MTFFEHFEALERLHSLIKRKATGTPEHLAELFKVSVSTIKNLLRDLKDKNLPVCYCRERETYYYEYDVDVIFFKIVSKEEQNKITGGINIFNYFLPRQNTCLDTFYTCTKLTNYNEHNTASSYVF